MLIRLTLHEDDYFSAFNNNNNRVLKCDVIKMKFLKLWECQDILKEQCPRGLLAKNEHFGENCLWDRSPVMLRKLHKKPSFFFLLFWVDPLIPIPHSWVFTSVSMDSSPRSYLFTSGTVRIPVRAAPKCATEPIWYVTFLFRDQCGAASLC